MKETGLATIEVTTTDDANSWEPTRGENTELLRKFLLSQEKLDSDAFESVNAEAADILRKCEDLTTIDAPSKTILCVGKVQSGKTLSFTNLMALAADNGIKLIICFGGSTQILTEQNYSRLIKDLQTEKEDSSIRIIHQDDYKSEVSYINSIVSGGSRYNSKKTVLLTVLKNYSRIRDLREMVKNNKILAKSRPLIVSDEADEIELNTSRNNAEEATRTHNEIKYLREAFSSSIYCQYTATPAGILSACNESWVEPDSCVRLYPGEGYCGGREFFDNNVSPFKDELHSYTKLVKDVNADQNTTEIPNSLAEAMHTFFLGNADYVLKTDNVKNLDNRSMVVHPHKIKIAHKQWESWVRNHLCVLKESSDEELIELLSASHADLQRTVSDIKPLQELIEELRHIVDDVVVKVVNSDHDTISQKHWKYNKFTILVGGNTLGRGFTVEGLSVTHMARNSSPQDDTLHQRARFFGYKSSYIQYCRLFLDQMTIRHYQDYSNIEERLLDQIEQVQHNIITYKEFSENLALESSRPNSSPTSRAKIRREHSFIPLKEQRYHHDFYPIDDAKNNELAECLINNFADDFKVYDGGYSSKSAARSHKKGYLPLVEIINYIEGYKTSPLEAEKFTAISAALDKFYKNDEKAKCCVFIMAYDFLRRRNSSYLDPSALFQGMDDGGGRSVYPGDKAIFDRDVSNGPCGNEVRDIINLQIHKICISPESRIVYVPAIRFYAGTRWQVM